MKAKRLHSLFLSALLGLFAGLPASADDTEIYLGPDAIDEELRPNVLFILDTSGSMNEPVAGTGKDRLDNMKDALNLLLDSVNNVNVGLMRFTDPGGPVLFPIAYIEEDVDVVEGKIPAGMDVNSRIDQGSDDAVQRQDDSMVLDGTGLEMMEYLVLGASQTVNPTVANQNNNAEQRLSDGDIITQNAINMGDDQTNAVRFQNLAIPEGAKIIDARIDFTARNNFTGDSTLWIRGQKHPNPPAFPISCNGCKDVTNRLPTQASVIWQPASWVQDNVTTTPNLAAIVQEIVGPPGGVSPTGWVSGNSMVFGQGADAGSSTRAAHTHKGDSAKAAQLQLTYAQVTGTDQNKFIGLRFRDVGVPWGADIKNAYIEFYPAETGAKSAKVEIYGELTPNAATFSATAGDIGARMPSPSSVTWTIPAWKDVDTPQQTPDLTDLVQDIVKQSGWCGNNAMAFLIKKQGDGPRIAESYEGDPSRAPVLRIDYDKKTVPSGACIAQTIQRQVRTGNDDAEETKSSGNVSRGGNHFNMRSSQINGLRFQDVAIPQGATILSAELVLTASQTDAGAVTLTFQGQDNDTAAAFKSNNKDVSKRTPTTAKVDWPITAAWNKVGEKHVSVDIGPIIQEIVDRGSWLPGNDLVITQTHKSGGERDVITYNNDPANAPALRITFQGSVVSGGTGYKSVRQKLKEIVNDLDHAGWTPIVDTLYEAASYYRGENVHWGLTRGNGSTNTTVRKNTRVSHPASWTGGTVNQPGNCSDDDPNHSDCVNESISGGPDYISPIEKSCQFNFIVLLTDGEANHNHSEGLIKTMTGKSSCINSDADESCGEELVEFLATKDQSALPGDSQHVFTYTIGFNISNQFLKDLANKGQGQFHEANNADELLKVFNDIFVDILSKSTSFASPSLTVNAFNKLFHRDAVYFSLFRPENAKAWKGNVKKYRICPDGNTTCQKGEILDADGNLAVGTDDRISDTARSYWSATADGPKVTEGGAGPKTPPHGTRRVFTYTDSTTAPVNVGLDTADHRVLAGKLNPKLTKTLLGDGAMTDADRTALIDWIRGKDVDDEDGDGDFNENRYSFSDPLHSSPMAITFGGTATAPVIKVFVGTNDGGLRMINAHNGKEEWIFYPEEMLAKQKDLRANAIGDHIYGLDSTPTVWVYDKDKDGVIEKPDDFVRVYIGMRRGGRNIYALDVTPSAPLTDRTATGQVLPTLMFRLQDGSSSAYPNLGQTWSEPKLAVIQTGTSTAREIKDIPALLFAGGYDGNNDTQDGGFGQSSPGNAIYAADPVNGKRLFSISNSDPGDGGTWVKVDEMTYPMPSDLATLDSDGDGEIDRLYVGDTGGQLWRVDLKPDLTASPGIKPVVRLFAKVADQNTADASKNNLRRKFFYAPDIVEVKENVYSSMARYNLIAINSGNRAHPLDLTVDDLAFGLRDYFVAPYPDGNDDGVADGDIDGDTSNDPPLMVKDLFDATEFFQKPTGTDLDDLKDADGWFIQLEDDGEKGLSKPIVLDGKMFFTSYLPEGAVDTTNCSLQEGAGRLYGVDVLTGAAFPWDEVNDGKVTSKVSRYAALGAGVPSGAVPIFQKKGITLLIGTGGGAKTIDPGIDLPRERTYWSQD